MESPASSIDVHESAARGLPVFPGSDLPPPEPPLRRLVIHSVALLAFAVSLAYLGWRALFTVDPASWWVSFPFLGLEIFALFSLTLFAFSLWDLDVRPPARPAAKTNARIAVLIPTYNESREILIPTIAAAVALEPEHETWVLDDGRRLEVEQLASELGARYLVRPDRRDAKAGNINHALGRIDADLIAVLDADHVASPNFLKHALAYFDDPKVALVQTPQDFYNLGSFEHEDLENPLELSADEPLFHEQELFYRAIQPGKNRWGAAFWCGTGAVVRVAALRDVGGVATGTVTEDIHTTIRLHRRGWKSIYHNEVLARGLAAATAEQYQLQRLRWGTGAMQVLRLENPLIAPGLRLPQRIAYASTLLGWFESWRTLGYLLLPCVVLLTGGMPVRADAAVFGIAFGLTLALQQTALRLLSRGYHHFVLSTLFDIVRLTPNLRATLTLFYPARPRFRVTPKGRESSQRDRINPPPLLVALAIVSGVAAVWFVLTLAGLTPLRYETPWLAYGAAFWLAVNLGLMLAAIARTQAKRFGPERRSSVRFSTGLSGTIDGRPCRIREMSLTGGLVSMSEPLTPPSDDGRRGFTVGVLGRALSLGAVVRWQRRQQDGRTLLGLQFCDGQTQGQAQLALALLNRELVLAKKGPREKAA